MGNWIPNDLTLAAQLLKIITSFATPPPGGLGSLMLWENEPNVIAQFVATGIRKEQISFSKGYLLVQFSRHAIRALRIIQNILLPNHECIRSRGEKWSR
jgi:hypothetical protein